MTSKEKRLKVRYYQHQLKMIDLERKFIWKTPKYQDEHSELLDKQEENLRKKLEEVL